MSYRDDLDAALSRINALERVLDGDDEVTSELRASNETLRAEVARLRQELFEARAVAGELEQRLYGRPAPRSKLEELPTLAEHNRQLPVQPRRPSVLVVCPACITVGDRVEMMRLRKPIVSEDLGTSVMCPNCGVVGVMR